LLRRGKGALVDNAAWRGSRPLDVAADGVAPLKEHLQKEVTAALTKMLALAKAMADPARTDLVALDDATVDPARRFKRTYMSLYGMTAEQMRGTAIITAGWMTLADKLEISDDDLHMLVSRRLMMTERMLWYVGVVRPGARTWNFAPAKHKEWQDGWNRMFEYPRLSALEPFKSLCKPKTGSTTCDPDGQMPGWSTPSQGQFHHDAQLNPTAAPRFTRPPGTTYEFHFKKGGPDPAQAVLAAFTPSNRFDQRNLLLCDQVIHLLHLESLLRVKSKREGGTAWLEKLTDAKPTGWLRVDYPSKVDDMPGGEVFLVSSNETLFFERRKILVDTLEVGDHVIVYNHPAYDRVKSTADVWRLENALVVATYPKLLLQGHGTYPLPFSTPRRTPVKDKSVDGSMRLNMLDHFNSKLVQLRAAALEENKKASPREEIDDFDSDAKLVQRGDIGPFSGYDPSGFTSSMTKLARWWMRWEQDDEQKEPKIAADEAWAKQTWEKSRVELTDGFGFFPLWLPRTDKRGNPVRKGGKISELTEVTVVPKMASGWDWYYEKDESREEGAAHRVAARRPKVS
jgi:hypothetical protein